MKRILFISCVFFALAISVNAGELYRCIDSTGNSVFTDSPQDGMKDCVLEESYVKPAPEETVDAKEQTNVEKNVEKDNVVAKEKEVHRPNITRINNCISCCNNKSQACYNYTADSRLCNAENQNCSAMCKSEGSAPSSWSDCWSQFN